MIWFFLLALLFYISAVVLILRENASTADKTIRIQNIMMLITGGIGLVLLLVVSIALL